MTGVDYCITTIERPRALERLLLSIAAHEPEAAVYVADQSEAFDSEGYDRLAQRLEEAGLRRRPTVDRLPFDCGLSTARNHLVDSTPSECKLILDDDFVFTEQTDVSKLVRLLELHPEAAAVGGGVVRGGRIRHAGTLLQRDGTTLRQLAAGGPLQERAGIRFRQTDCVPNFVLMRRQLFEHMRWDPDLKTAGEHIDFYLRMQDTPYGVLYTPDVTIDHPPVEAEPGYKRLRWRGGFLKQVLIKHEAVRLESVNGAVTELQPDGSLTRHSEPAA